MTHCKACSEATLSPLWTDRHGQEWFQCHSCGSHNTPVSYEEVRHVYNDEYIVKHAEADLDHRLTELRANLDWFVDYKVKDEVGKDFLDVGHCEGSSLTGMAERGYSVHGFDVNPSAARPGCTTIAPYFTADLFPQKYHAVLCREVIEHVDTPHQFITDLYRVTAPRGYLQLQTPRPSPWKHDNVYAHGHLVILSPLWVRYCLERQGFEVKDYRFWGGEDRQAGQAWMCRKL